MAWFRRKSAAAHAQPLTLTEEHLVKGPVGELQGLDDRVLQQISDNLRDRLHVEFTGLIEQVVQEVMRDSREEIEEAIRTRLIESLEPRTTRLVDQAIKSYLTRDSGED